MTTGRSEGTPRPRRRSAPRSRTVRDAPEPASPAEPPGAAGVEPGPATARAAGIPPGPEPEPQHARHQRRSRRTERQESLTGFAEATSRVVHQAASILEEEIAAGVVAAKQVEERFVNVGELRSGSPDDVIQRFRRDSHEIVDILIDVAQVATRSLGSLAGRAVRVRPAMPGAGDRPDTGPSSSMTPTLTLPEPLRAGGSSEVAMNVENDSDNPTAEFGFHNTDLVNQDGHRIPADRVTFSSPRLSLGPHQSERVVISVAVPKATPPGTYSGLLQASRLDQLRAILVVVIE